VRAALGLSDRLPQIGIAGSLRDYGAHDASQNFRFSSSVKTAETTKVGHRHYMSRDGSECASVVPCIRLSGHWLAGLGFGVGKSIEVEVRGCEVVLRLAGGREFDGQQVP